MTLSTSCGYNRDCNGAYCLSDAIVRQNKAAAFQFSEDHLITSSTDEKTNNLTLAIKYLPDLELLAEFLRLDPNAVHFIGSAHRYPLLEATELGNPEILRLLFDHSADANFCDPLKKTTALHHLAESAADFFLHRAPDSDARYIEPIEDRTIRVSQKITRVAKTLIEHGARVDLRDMYDRTPLQLYMNTWARSTPSILIPDFISILIAEGANPVDAIPIQRTTENNRQKIQQAVENGLDSKARVTACNTALEPVLPNPLRSEPPVSLYPKQRESHLLETSPRN